MESRRLILCLLLLTIIICGKVRAQDYNIPFNPPSSAATNFTTTLDYCWFVYTSGDEAGALNNPCTTGTDLSVNAGNAPANYTATPPTGSAIGKDAVTGDGTSSLTFTDPGAEPQSWSMGCWVNDTSSNDTIFYQADAAGTGINMRLKNSTQHQYDALSGGGSVLQGAAGSDAWTHVAVTYDHTNAGSDSLKLYVNGTQTATGNGGDPGSVTQNYFLMSNSTPGAVWNGLIYECFYDFNLLTASQICQIATTGLSGDASHTPGCTP